MVTLFGITIERKSPYKPSPRSGHTFSDEDQEAATEAKKLRAEQRRVQAEIALTREQMRLEKEKTELALAQEKLRRYTEPDDEDDEEEARLAKGGFNIEQMIMAGMMQGMMQGKQQQAPLSWDDAAVIQTPQGIPKQQVQQVQFTDAEIKEWIKGMGRVKKAAAKKMSDDSLRKQIFAEMPNIHPETVERAIKIFRSQ